MDTMKIISFFVVVLFRSDITLGINVTVQLREAISGVAEYTAEAELIQMESAKHVAWFLYVNLATCKSQAGAEINLRCALDAINFFGTKVYRIHVITGYDGSSPVFNYTDMPITNFLMAGPGCQLSLQRNMPIAK